LGLINGNRLTTFHFDRIKTKDAAKLQDEYAKLVEGLQGTMEESRDTDDFMENPRMSTVSSFRI
jgi:hypothetical protein